MRGLTHSLANNIQWCESFRVRLIRFTAFVPSREIYDDLPKGERQRSTLKRHPSNQRCSQLTYGNKAS
ncbi:hypothetical protein ACSYAD_08910 [Acaryochloris marina NIES-2412]|uniref:hypothetical protein n=1 Tax=Acaryochloris marina TaxID=155978 RepID=UPI0040594835